MGSSPHGGRGNPCVRFEWCRGQICDEAPEGKVHVALDHWEVEVGPARGIVTNAQAEVDRLQLQEQTLINAFTEAATACDHLDIGQALDALLHDFAGPLLQAARGAGTSITGQTGKAIDAYVQADEKMALDAEEAIHTVPRPEPYE